MADDVEAESAPPTYPIPEATIAAEPTTLAALAAVILGVLVFWRRKKPSQPS